MKGSLPFFLFIINSFVETMVISVAQAAKILSITFYDNLIDKSLANNILSLYLDEGYKKHQHFI